MSRFKVYSPDQAYLLPPSVRDELGAEHLCFFVRGVIERLDMSVFEQSYSAEGGELYAPAVDAVACGSTRTRWASPARGRWSGGWWRTLRSAIWRPASGWTTGR